MGQKSNNAAILAAEIMRQADLRYLRGLISREEAHDICRQISAEYLEVRPTRDDAMALLTELSRN